MQLSICLVARLVQAGHLLANLSGQALASLSGHHLADRSGLALAALTRGLALPTNVGVMWSRTFLIGQQIKMEC